MNGNSHYRFERVREYLALTVNSGAAPGYDEGRE
jgi:hypothetical protein